MRRFALAACLLTLPGFAAGQDGGVIIVANPGPIDITLPPDVVLPPDFSLPPIVFEPVRPVDMSGALWGPQQQRPTPQPDALPPIGEAALLGEAPLVTVEEEGVRMPDEQFSLD